MVGIFGTMQLGLVENKMAIEGRQMIMMLGPNKTAVAKLQATAKSSADKAKNKGQVNGKSNSDSTVIEEPATAKEPKTSEEPETAPFLVDT